MVSIRTTSPEEMIGYVIPGESHHVTNHYKEPNWDQSMLQLAKGLQNICRSPEASDKDRYFRPLSKPLDHHSTPSTPSAFQQVVPQNSAVVHSSPTIRPCGIPLRSLSESIAPQSPTSLSPLSVQTAQDVFTVPTDAAGQRMPVRHQQSETKLEQKLKEICHSPREKVLPHDHRGKTACGQKLCHAHRRPSFLHQPQFIARADVGTCKAEDLVIKLEDSQLNVSVKDNVSTEYLCSVSIPTDVDTQHLVCILRDNKLEVSQTGKRKPACERHSHSMSSAEGVDYIASIPDESTPAPIVIEDKVDTDSVRLVLTVPSGYRMEHITIQTVDDHLIIKGRPHRRRKRTQRSKSMDSTSEQVRRYSPGVGVDVLGFTRVFELPNSWDPFSIVAQLNEKHQLIIDAKLTYRCRCHTL